VINRSPVPNRLTAKKPAGFEACIYCGSFQSGTRDHVPPKCLFPKPRPLETVTVPACFKCNASFQKDDEYFLIAMAGQGYRRDPEADRVWQTIIRPLLVRSPRFRAMISRNILKEPVRTPAGLVLPKMMAIRFDWLRIQRVVRRIVRGLLWHHYGQLPGQEIELEVFAGRNIPAEVANAINTMTNVSWIGDTIFRYRHAVADGAPDSSIWALQFYTQTQFIVIVRGESFVSAEQQLEDS
jgi:hypothetical protein